MIGVQEAVGRPHLVAAHRGTLRGRETLHDTRMNRLFDADGVPASRATLGFKIGWQTLTVLMTYLVTTVDRRVSLGVLSSQAGQGRQTSKR